MTPEDIIQSYKRIYDLATELATQEAEFEDGYINEEDRITYNLS